MILLFFFFEQFDFKNLAFDFQTNFMPMSQWIPLILVSYQNLVFANLKRSLSFCSQQYAVHYI